MRLPLLGLVVILGFSAAGSQAQAQIGGINDPFFAYYSFYLPRQQAQAMSPGPEATINAFASSRQYYAATNSNRSFDPNGGFGGADFDDGFSPNSGTPKRKASSYAGRYGVHGQNLNGLGPPGYYNSRLNQYYRDLRTGRGKNANVSVIRSRGHSGGYGGMSSGLPGPR